MWRRKKSWVMLKLANCSHGHIASLGSWADSSAFSQNLLRSRGMVLEPGDVHIPATRDGRDTVINRSFVLDRHHRAIIPPAVNFRMTIRKGKPAGIPMIRGRNILESITAGVVRRIASHERVKIAPVDGIFPLVNENKDSCRTGIV